MSDNNFRLCYSDKLRSNPDITTYRYNHRAWIKCKKKKNLPKSIEDIIRKQKISRPKLKENKNQDSSVNSKMPLPLEHFLIFER